MGDDFYRRNLPHIVPPGATFFVTFRLAGSLPREVVQRWADEDRELTAMAARLEPQEAAAKVAEAKRHRFREAEGFLDAAATGPTWLAERQVAEVVAAALAWLEDHKATVQAYCIMPNHVHALLTPWDPPFTLSDVMQSLKGYTAKQANRHLPRGGTFWQHESYDHYVRSENEYEKMVAYILRNPVKAGLVADAGDWPWSYAVA